MDNGGEKIEKRSKIKCNYLQELDDICPDCHDWISI